jgi:hypothetical protein
MRFSLASSFMYANFLLITRVDRSVAWSHSLKPQRPLMLKLNRNELLFVRTYIHISPAREYEFFMGFIRYFVCRATSNWSRNLHSYKHFLIGLWLRLSANYIVTLNACFGVSKSIIHDNCEKSDSQNDPLRVQGRTYALWWIQIESDHISVITKNSLKAQAHLSIDASLRASLIGPTA